MRLGFIWLRVDHGQGKQWLIRQPLTVSLLKIEINLGIFQRDGIRPVQVTYLTFLVEIRQGLYVLHVLHILRRWNNYMIIPIIIKIINRIMEVVKLLCF